MTHTARCALALVLVTILLSAVGCGHRLTQALLPESRPQLRLDRVPLQSPSPGAYAYLARWSALPSGRPLDHYLVALDPPSVDAVDATWMRTTATERVLTFPVPDKSSRERESHVFAVRAVDDRGEMSDTRWFAVAGVTIPPTVRITHPVPSALVTALVPPTIRIDWEGTDPDGIFTQEPVRYVLRLFGQHNPDFPAISDFITFALAYPDSFRRLYSPGFEGWTSTQAETTSTELTDLTPGSNYLFVVSGFDEAGYDDPVFSANKNMLRMAIVHPGSVGPTLTMFDEFFNYTYPNGGWLYDPSRTVRVDLPANQPLTLNWFATPSPGAEVVWYRWSLNSVDLLDETPRVNEATDLQRWSARSLNTTSVTLGPFSPPPSRVLSQTLFIDVMDSNGLRSLGIVNFVIRRPTFTDELLVVDDTRLRVDFADAGLPGQVQPPAGPWPTKAELDTFLFARGGYPWRSYPTGTLSPPGILNGYRYDTLSTRSVMNVLPLSTLGRYRHVLWYTDEVGASYTQPPNDPAAPITALRQMSAPGQASALAAYVQQGGKLWLCGGGAAFASLIPWNRPGTSSLEYTARDNELVPGRFMYDFAHWREAIQMLPSIQARRFGTTSFGVGANRPGRGWPSNPIPPTPPAPPDYTLLPTILQPRTPATDPRPPLRFDDTFYYFNSHSAEYISKATFIREDYDDDPGVVAEFSTLDTLYITSGGTALQNAPCMSYYHGRDSQPVVFSGFNIWYWRRTQCIGLVDWALHSVWGLERDAGAPREPGAAALAARPR